MENSPAGFCSASGIYQSPWSSSLPLHSSPPLSLPHFLFSSSHRRSKPAFIDAVSGETLTYDDLFFLTTATSRALIAAGIRHGDVVLLVSPNSIFFPALSLGIMAAGAVFSTANHLLTRRELLAQVEDSRPVLILTTAELRPKLEGLIPLPPLLIDQFLSTLPTLREPDCAAVAGDLDRPAALMYSSGTTGRSKGVVCTHRNLVAVAAVLRLVWGAALPQREKEAVAVAAGCDDVYLCVVPLFHMFGFSVFVCGAIAAGSAVVVMRRYSLEGMLAAVEQLRVTRLPAVPPMVVQLAKAGHVAEGYDIRSLREVICSGAPLPREHMARFGACYPEIILSQCYGLTETSGPLTLCDGLIGRTHASIGRLIPSIEAKIVDARTGIALSPNRLGELCVKGPPVMKGYLNNPEATSLAIDEQGWLHTGDLCYIDTCGLVYVVDRIKELIKYKAYQVAPAELEEILSTHSEIEDVAVVSHPDEEAGEVPMACVVRKAGSGINTDDIISYMENKVAPYKRIRKVMFVEHIPRSASGKIIRRQLKDSDLVQHEISARL